MFELSMETLLSHPRILNVLAMVAQAALTVATTQLKAVEQPKAVEDNFTTFEDAVFAALMKLDEVVFFDAIDISLARQIIAALNAGAFVAFEFATSPVFGDGPEARFFH